MEAIEFITAIRKRVIESDFKVYQELLNTTNEANDPVWNEALLIYNDLTNEQQESFLSFLRLIQVNAVSHFLGILDGSTYLNERREDFILKTERGNKPLNGNLQDLFLEIEEDERL